MIVTIKKTTETTEQVEVKVPSYYKAWPGYYFINSEGRILYVNNTLILSYQPGEGEYYYQENLSKAIASEEISKEEFMTQWRKTSEKFLAIVDDVASIPSL